MKKLYMIGNSHIDPVWLWTWEEGMQEVKATFASALERLNEYEDFVFTSTSAAFFKWIEKTVPGMFEEIKRRVAEGRWELTGGWFIEPDCILPCGEAFVRQGLYAQRYFKEKFGKICRIGSNVDSFGHGPTLPQILKKSGMDCYVFMRPRLDTPVFIWESEDKSRVNAISLPAEYTTWFHGPTMRNIERTLERTPEWPIMACCYGVGNHGGGPTKENIESIIGLKDQFAEAKLDFSSFERFFKDLDKTCLKTLKGPFEKVNTGCYSVDAKMKKMNRLAEARLIQADGAMALSASVTDTWMAETANMQVLWETVLFNQFHDTLGGTAIKRARDEAVLQLSSACAQSGYIKALALQNIVNSFNTYGEGFPLFLFNLGGIPYDGMVNAEVEWFCQNALTLLDPDGNEVPYQRISTETKIKHTVLGGRRRILFKASIPAFGFAVYRLINREPEVKPCKGAFYKDEDNYCLENDFIKAQFDRVTGLLTGLIDKEESYSALTGPVEYQVWLDERDTWGHEQGRSFGNTGECFKLLSIEKVEKGPLRQTIRAVYRHGGSVLQQLYHLYAGERELVVENRLLWDKPWQMFKIGLPVGYETPHTRAEVAYGVLKRRIEDADEYFMHRWLDVTDESESRGLAIANDGRYAFNYEKGKVQLTVLRSAIYAQGQSPGWYDTAETYLFSDLGEHEFTYVFRPHGRRLENYQLTALTQRIGGAYEYLADSCHGGAKALPGHYSMASMNCRDVQICLIKKAEDDMNYVLRLLETEGKPQRAQLHFMGTDYPVDIGPYEIKTLKIDPAEQTAQEVNLIEWQVEA